MDGLLHDAMDLWRRSRRAIAFTGAGISVPSGIPDFRSPGGLWSHFDPQEVASIQALHANPTGVWEFLLEAVTMFTRAKPNPAHLALARLESCGKLGTLITQNIDGLHQAAGSKDVVEFHGGCQRFYCMRCKREYDPAAAARLTRNDIPWLCACGGLIRPEVVFFGETIPHEAMRRTGEAVSEADLVLIVGTSGEVAPANLIPRQVKADGGHVIEVNLGPTAFAGVSDVRFDAPAEVVLPALADLVCA